MTFKLHRGLILATISASTLAIAFSSAATAQSSASDNNAATGGGDIVVTALRRSESLSKVPLAVSVISGEAIAKRGINEVFDLQREVPSLQTPQTGNTEVLMSLRGLGADDYNPAAPPAVGFYADGVFINSTAALLGGFYDASRVEVLKGPQGTLWGRNTTSGLVQLVNNRPTNELEGYASVEFGNYGRQKFEAAVSGPIIEDKLSARVSLLKNSFNGFYSDKLHGENYGYSDWSSARLQLLWTPSAQTEIWAKYETQQQDSQLPFTFQGVRTGGVDAYGYAGYSNPFDGEYYTLPETTLKTQTAALSVDHEFDSGLKFTNIAAYVHSVTYPYYNLNASPNPVQSGLGFTASKQYTDEIRLTSPSGGRFNWIVGGFFMRQDLDVYGIYLTDVTLSGSPGAIRAGYTQQSTSVAAFASGTYELIERLKLSVGVRFNHDKISTHATTFLATPNADRPFNQDLLTNRIPIFDGNASVSNNEPTGDITLAYEVSDNLNAYARIARGFRSAVINNIVTSPAGFTISKPEKLNAYEVGLKGSSGSLFSFDIAAFYYDYINKQVFQDLGNLNRSLVNTSMDIKGIEASFRLKPTNDLSLGVSSTYLHARYGRFPGAIVDPTLNLSGTTDLSGRSIPRAPKFTAVLFGEYGVDTAIGKVSLRADWKYQSAQFFLNEFANVGSFNYPAGIDPRLVRDATSQGSYWLGDVSLDWKVNDNFGVTAYVRNVTNKYYQVDTAYFNIGQSFRNNYGPPQTYGISARYDF